MSYFEHYFSLPTIHIDGDYEVTKEERKEKTGFGEVEFNPEYLICETDIAPDDEVVTLTEAWFPSEEGFEYARDNQKFRCCRVSFMNAGQFLVAMPKSKFKKLWSEFKDVLPKIGVLELTKEQTEEFLTNINKIENE